MKPPPPRRVEEKEQGPALEGTIVEAKELSPGDRVVYPKQGVCRVVGLEQKEIAGQRLELVRMTREEDGASVLVPMGKVSSIGLRRVATPDQIDGIFHYLAAQYEDPELDWKVRHRDNVERLIAGGVLGVAEVVKGLHSLSRLRPLPPKEREQYDNARHLLVNEVAVSLAVPPGHAEDFVDYALTPPAGVKFQLKPPPKPVVLTVPAYRRKKPAPVAEEEDLGLSELGLDLGEITGEGAEEAAEGEGAPAKEEAAEAAKPTRAAKAKPPRAARKAQAKKAPARKAARKPAPRRPAPKKKAPPPKGRGGKKR